MTWDNAGVIAEIAAAISVIVSLWYLALELKQNTELARAQLEVNWASPGVRLTITSYRTRVWPRPMIWPKKTGMR